MVTSCCDDLSVMNIVHCAGCKNCRIRSHLYRKKTALHSFASMCQLFDHCFWSQINALITAAGANVSTGR